MVSIAAMDVSLPQTGIDIHPIIFTKYFLEVKGGSFTIQHITIKQWSVNGDSPLNDEINGLLRSMDAKKVFILKKLLYGGLNSILQKKTW